MIRHPKFTIHIIRLREERVIDTDCTITPKGSARILYEDCNRLGIEQLVRIVEAMIDCKVHCAKLKDLDEHTVSMEYIIDDGQLNIDLPEYRKDYTHPVWQEEEWDWTEE